MQDKIEDIDFLPCLEFEMIKNLENCLLVFDDSCGDLPGEGICKTCSLWSTLKGELHFCQTYFVSPEQVVTHN